MSGRVTFAGYLADDEIDDYLAASDVCLCMRWPTSRETSASWLRCLAAGKPTISTDLVHTVDVPTLDPRDWSVLDARLKSRPTDTKSVGPVAKSAGPVGVSIDILDEDHSLKLAVRRLASDEKLRVSLGSNAHALWAERFRLERMVAGYQEAISRGARNGNHRARTRALCCRSTCDRAARSTPSRSSKKFSVRSTICAMAIEVKGSSEELARLQARARRSGSPLQRGVDGARRRDRRPARLSASAACVRRLPDEPAEPAMGAAARSSPLRAVGGCAGCGRMPGPWSRRSSNANRPSTRRWSTT